MTQGQAPPVLQAIDALKRGDRRAAAALLQRELDEGPPSGDRWRSISRLASEIGEIDIALEASRRTTVPPTLDRLLVHCGNLATYGRSSDAVDLLSGLSARDRERPAVLHFLGVVAAESGRFEEAQEHYRRALTKAPDALPTWFALAMIKTFTAGDPDLETMQKLAGRLHGADAEPRARFLYALAKAYDDCGDTERAAACFTEGAAIRRGLERYDPHSSARAADAAIAGFTAETLGSLVPSGAGEQRSIFVTGLPRSGTTLVEQILTAHSQVSDGGETNLLRPALIPTLDYSFEGAFAYQQRQSGNPDPWGDIGRDYGHFIDMRFRAPGRVVDKTIGISAMMGLLLHALPLARIVWLRRSPEDVALSCFRTYFTAPVPWSWSLEDIAAQMRIEDRLFRHWQALAPDRILEVPYEDLASDPDGWIKKILAHLALEGEEQVERFHERERIVRTASLQQVRSPVSTDRVGIAKRYERLLEPFRAAYYGP